MKLIDYIKSARRGRDANRIEREAMSDPFLSDAIEGFDAVYGNHSDKLKSLEETIVRRATRRRRKGRGAPVTPVQEVVPQLLPVGDRDPRPMAVVAKAAAAPAKPRADETPEPAREEASKPKTQKGKKRPLVGEDADASVGVAAAEEAAAETAAPVPAQTPETARDEISAPAADVPEKRAKKTNGRSVITDEEHTSPRRRPLRWLRVAAAAVLVAGLAGGAWYYLEYIRPPAATMVAQDFTEMAAPEVSVTPPEEIEAVKPVVFDMADLTVLADEQAAQPGEEASPVGRRIQPAAERSTPKAGSSPARTAQPEAVQVPEEKIVASGAVAEQSEFDTAAEVARRLPVAALAMADSRTESAELTATRATDVREDSADAAGSEAEEEEVVVTGFGNGQSVFTGSVSTLGQAQAHTSGVQAQLSAQAGSKEVDTVRSEEFLSYFAANKKVTDVRGVVVVEFRVNSRGVPSGISVISSPSPDAGQEVVRLLVNGPRWSATSGKRIRTAVEYK